MRGNGGAYGIRHEPAHCGAVFIVMVVSGAGIFTTLSIGTLHNNAAIQAMQLFKMFGIGVIAATGWIHLLPDAFSKFSSPCLEGGPWAGYGTNFVGVFALFATFMVQLIELAAFGHAKCPPENDNDPPELQRPANIEGAMPAGHAHDPQLESHFHEDSKGLGVVILEAGIVFHSLIIGVTLGAQTDDFVTLLVAVCFHQMFEGMALGSLIAQLQHKTWVKFFILGLVYPMTRPSASQSASVCTATTTKTRRRRLSFKASSIRCPPVFSCTIRTRSSSLWRSTTTSHSECSRSALRRST